MEIILFIFSFLTLILWIFALVWTSWTLFIQKPLEPTNSSPKHSGKISIIVPARNEANRVLSKSISSMLLQDYEDFEVVAIDDRSTDATWEILAEIASDNPKLKLIKGRETEFGWLGKPFALQQGFQQASGDWILATDADIIFAKNALKTAVAFAIEKELDALTLIPKVNHGSFWETLFMPIFGWFCFLAMPPNRVNDPKRKEAMGVGNFFLFRRSVLECLDGFTVVKNEVAEDLRMAEILKKRGYRFRIEYAPNLIETRMYSSLKEIWEGFTKNLFSGLRFSVHRAILGSFAIFFLGVLPIFLAFIFWFMSYKTLAYMFFLVYAMQVITFVVIHLRWKGNPLYALLTPVGLLLFMMILLNSTVKIVTGKGVTWKDRKIYEAGGVEPPR